MTEKNAKLSEFNDPGLEVLIPAEAIRKRIAEMGEQIARDYAGRRPLLVCVLKGAMVFMADLIRSIDLPLAIDFIAVSSYGSGTRSTGEVKIIKDLDAPAEGSDLIFVEDILDTGLTLSYLLENFRARGTASITIAALLNKPDRRKVEVHLDYKGFDIPDEFVVGYGLDFDERYRNLPYIGVVRTVE